MDPKMAELFDRLFAAADQIGIQAARLWPQVVMVTFIQSSTNVALSLVLTVGGFFLVRKWLAAMVSGRRTVLDEGDSNADSMMYGLGIGLLLFAYGIVILISIATLTSSLPGVFAPEAVTVMRLAKIAP